MTRKGLICRKAKQNNQPTISVLLYCSYIDTLVWFGLVWFYGTSTIVGYLMMDPYFIYINSSISNK